MTTDAPADIAFSIPFIHRLRFTQDILGADDRVLLDLLEPSGELPPRVQFWVDESIAQAQPDFRHRLRGFVARHAGRITPTGNIQIVSGGESVKNDIHILERMLKVFHAANLDRRSYVVVVGGGAVLDAVGFAAAIAHRGIRLIRLPTTTLAQADSGVGVKNSVNLFHKKNWLGTFAVPWGIINDISLLNTLPDRDFRCGFSEAVKVTLLKNADHFSELCRTAELIRDRDMAAAQSMIRISAELHRAHITQGGDPFEMLEARPLDYGHWSAHKMEVMSDFQLKHGEAVAIGVAVDTIYSSLVHGLPRAHVDRVLKCLNDLGLTLDHAALHDTETLFAGLEEFRQHLGGRLTLTMLRNVGDPLEVHEVNRDAMRQAIREVADFAKAQRTPRPAVTPK
jgi:3-dehydroquinate synthase